MLPTTSPRSVIVQDWVPDKEAMCSGPISQRLQAAKPISWRGPGDLPQFPWAQPFKGLWLILDLWSGFGGLAIALLSLGIRCCVLAAEMDPTAAEVAHSVMPNIVHVAKVESVSAAMVVPFLRRRSGQLRGIILGGGSPCQGNSALNTARRGLADQRSLQPSELTRIRGELEALPECADLEIITFLENVASMPAQVQAQYTEWLGFPPVVCDSKACGWVQRRRFLWLGRPGRCINHTVPLPEGWHWLPNQTDPPEMAWSGPKPIPTKVHFNSSFQPMFDAAEVVKAGGEGAMHPFTREFFHPADRVSWASPEAAARFYDDQRRFPPSAYEAGSLLWRADEWRQPDPEERSQMMGFPARCLHSVPGAAAIRRQRQNSLIGNGFHLPMIVALFCMLPSVLEAKMPRPILDPVERALCGRLQGTIWEPGRLATYPGLSTMDHILRDMQQQLQEFALPDSAWRSAAGDLQLVNGCMLQAFTAWSLGHGSDCSLLGPTVVSATHRAEIYAGLTGQRYPGNSSRGLDFLLPPGLGKAQHIQASAVLPSRFRPRPWPEPDLDFVLHAISVWQEKLPVYADQCRRQLDLVAAALRPLEEALAPHRSASAQRVAAAKKPAMMAFLTALLRWPDRRQAAQLVKGYPIVGVMETTGVFRSVPAKDQHPLEHWLGAAAIEAIDAIEAKGPPRHYKEIYDLTIAEQAKHFCSEFLSRRDLDGRFGRGAWRPLERFLIIQSDGKQRMIDNARRTRHNFFTSMDETIYTVSIDIVPAAIRQLSERMGFSDPEQWSTDCPWLHFRLGTDDLPDAYRGLPVCEPHLPYSVVAVWVPHHGWRYTILWGLAYGLESAVVSFNRFPQLGVAAARRTVYALAAAYF